MRRPTLTVAGLVAVVTAATVALLVGPPAPAGALENGAEVTVAEFGRYGNQLGAIATLGRPGVNTEFCGGTLIATRLVLTAAHCIEDERPEEIQVALGARRRGGGETHQVTGLYWSTDYTKNNANGFDVGLVRLGTDSKQTPIPLAAAHPALNSDLVFYSFGPTVEGGRFATTMRKAAYTLMSTAANRAPCPLKVVGWDCYRSVTGAPTDARTYGGDSGFPFLRETATGFVIVSVMSATYPIANPGTGPTQISEGAPVPNSARWINGCLRECHDIADHRSYNESGNRAVRPYRLGETDRKVYEIDFPAMTATVESDGWARVHLVIDWTTTILVIDRLAGTFRAAAEGPPKQRTFNVNCQTDIISEKGECRATIAKGGTTKIYIPSRVIKKLGKLPQVPYSGERRVGLLAFTEDGTEDTSDGDMGDAAGEAYLDCYIDAPLCGPVAGCVSVDLASGSTVQPEPCPPAGGTGGPGAEPTPSPTPPPTIPGGGPDPGATPSPDTTIP